MPELRVGNEVAEAYINEQLGGIGGRPLEVVRCATDGSPEKSIDCANQLIEAGVVGVMEGTDLGADAILPVAEGRGHPDDGARPVRRRAHVRRELLLLRVRRHLPTASAALRFYATRAPRRSCGSSRTSATSRGFTDGCLAPAAKQLGLDYQSVYYDAANPNWAVLATTAVAEQADVSGALAATDSQCADLTAALRDGGFQGRILAASCIGLHDAIGDKAVGVDTDSDHWNPGDIESAPPAKQDELREYAGRR